MGSSPENNSPIFLPQQDIEHKFDELEMQKYLQDTCVMRKIKQTVDKNGIYVVDSRFFDCASLSLFVDVFRSFGGLTFDSGR